MPPGVVQLVSRLAPLSGLSEDVVENVLNLQEPVDLDLAQVTTAMEEFRDFYIAFSAPATAPLSTFIGDSVSRAANACSILAYFSDDLTGATPFGSPVGMLSFTMGAATAGSPLPQEVAVVVSFNGDLTDVPITQPNPTPPPATIRPAQRRRGRLYFGPLQEASIADAAGIPRPVSTLTLRLTQAFTKMAQDISDNTDMRVGVWSKSDATVWQVVEGYVDDAWDTQRRRGSGPSTRTTFGPITP